MTEQDAYACANNRDSQRWNAEPSANWLWLVEPQKHRSQPARPQAGMSQNTLQGSLHLKTCALLRGGCHSVYLQAQIEDKKIITVFFFKYSQKIFKLEFIFRQNLFAQQRLQCFLNLTSNVAELLWNEWHSPSNVQRVTLIWSKNGTLMVTNLSCEAGASGGKPGQHHGCFCRHPPAGGDQIAALLPWQPASGQPTDAGGRISAKTRALRRPSPTGRWVRGDREPSDKSTGCDWLGQNLPVKCKR